MSLFTPIFAYFDPGSGSYVLQFLLAGLFAFLYGLKTFWKGIASFFQQIFRKK